MYGSRRCVVLFCTIALLGAACGGGGGAPSTDDSAAAPASDAASGETGTEAASEDIAGAPSEDAAAGPTEDATAGGIGIAFEAPCDAVPASEVEAVLGSAPSKLDARKPGDPFPKNDPRRESGQKHTSYVCEWTTPAREGVSVTLYEFDEDNLTSFRQSHEGQAKSDEFLTCEFEDAAAGPGSWVTACEGDKYNNANAIEVVPAPPDAVLQCTVSKKERRADGVKEDVLTFCSAVVDALAE